MLALLLGLLSVAAVLAAALLPWLETPSGQTIGTGPSRVLLVLAVAGAVAAVAAQRRPGWALIPLLVLVVVTAVAVVTTEPGAMCWDGVDEDGDPVGGCEQDSLTAAPALLGLGSALAMLGLAVAWVTRPARPVPAVPPGR